MSPYLNRELELAEQAALESHVFRCEPCQRELEGFRMLLGALRALPSPSPPADLAARVMARYRAERVEGAVQHDVSEMQQGVSADARAAALQPSVLERSRSWHERSAGAAGSPPRSAALLEGSSDQPPLVFPPTQALRPAPPQSLVRSFALVAAVLFAVFTGTLLSDRGDRTPLRLGNLQARQVVDAMLPINLTAPSGTRGRLGQWNEASLSMVGTSAPERRLPPTEIAWQLPPGVQLNLPHCMDGFCLQAVDGFRQMNPANLLGSAEQQATHYVLMPCSVPSQGRYEQRVLWRAMRSGRYRAYVELRCDGLYRREAFDLEVQP